ncbi:MAG: hypothetical protein JXA82_04470 [Sedimentisphaerales bacterium]|nr:hypothetical protein [Sedimentisphaerales bacterium]
MAQHHATIRMKHKPGSALILVVVLTVLLSLIGVLFVMVSRLGEMGTSTIQDEHDIDAGVQAVVQRIETVLVDDLYGKDRRASLGEAQEYNNIVINEPFDIPGMMDPDKGGDLWLADIEPEMETGAGTPEDLTDDFFVWRHITDLYYDYDMAVVAPYLSYYSPGTPKGLGAWTLLGLGAILADSSSGMPMVQLPRQLPGGTNPETRYYAADADGDGVWDSLWVRIPDLYSSKGRPIWAAVRIVDNCGMLNLNVSHWRNYDTEWGCWLEPVYWSFLRGLDQTDASRKENIPKYHRADGTFDPSRDNSAVYLRDVLMHIENPGPVWRLFEINNELEIRNRFLLSSPTEAPFETESVAHYTFDAQGGPYRVLTVPRDASNNDFDDWKVRMNPANFNDTSGAWYLNDDDNYQWRYDRRHVCTFYSFDRNLRNGRYPLLYDRTRHQWREHAHYFLAPNGSAVSVQGNFLENTPEARRRILTLLYAFRAYFLKDYVDTPSQITDEILREAAKKSAQIVANLIDNIDITQNDDGPFSESIFGSQTNENGTYDYPTYITGWLVKEIIREVTGQNLGDDPIYAFGMDDDDLVYGLECQPFITQVFTQVLPTGLSRFAVELTYPYRDLMATARQINPVDRSLDLSKYRIKVGNHVYAIGSAQVPAAIEYVTDPTKVVILNINDPRISTPPGSQRELFNPAFDTDLLASDSIELQQEIPDPDGGFTYLTVDQVSSEQLVELLTTEDTGIHVLWRDDSDWRMANAELVEHQTVNATAYATTHLGLPNNLNPHPEGNGFQVPVGDDYQSWDSKILWWRHGALVNFERVLWIGHDVGDPNAITTKIGLAAAEGDVRYDIDTAPELLGYICFLNRAEGTLPGRVNVNSATKEVIRTAIPPNPDWVEVGEDPQDLIDDLATAIVETRKSGPFENLGDLLDVPGMKRFTDPNHPTLRETSGYDVDPIFDEDIEERDWILSRVSNIFTTRSDVFTAYIAIRIGAPQINDKGTVNPEDDTCENQADRRMIAIFDRSHVSDPSHRPKLVALHPVPEAR